MNPNKALWEKGDFTKIAAFMRMSGAALAKSIGVEPGARVLDVGCGDGTTALPLAQLGADVTGIDIASNLVKAGNARAAEAGLPRLSFHEGDASRLEGVADDTFDLTLSIFGAMFAPRPFDVAKEMVRVTKPGGRVLMGNWIPGDPTFISQVLRISSAFMPPPPADFVSPMTWGITDHVVERFTKAGVAADRIATEEDTFHFTSASQGPAEFVDLFKHFYGPTMNAFDAATKIGKADDLEQQLIALAQEHNKSANGGTFIPATFLRVTVTV